MYKTLLECQIKVEAENGMYQFSDFFKKIYDYRYQAMLRHDVGESLIRSFFFLFPSKVNRRLGIADIASQQSIILSYLLLTLLLCKDSYLTVGDKESSCQQW